MKLTPEVKLLAFGVLLYTAFSFYLTFWLGYDMFDSDVVTCWNESLRWKTPYNNFWAPGYPLLLALLRGITFHSMQPIVLMWLVSCVAYLVSLITVYRFAVYERFEYPSMLAAVFAVFPFVGLTRSVFPSSDISAIALMLLAMYAYRKENLVHFAIFAGGAMFFQKILWFFVPPLAVVAFIQYKQSRIWIPLAFVPLLIWAISGTFYYHDLFWFLRTKLLTSETSLPIFDGLVTPLLSNSFPRVIKGIFTVSIFLSVVYGMYYGVIHKLWLPFCVCFSLAIMCTIINSYEIWAVARYSKLLVIPFCVIFHHSNIDRLHISNIAFASFLAICLATNVAAGYYISIYVPVR